MDGWMDGWSIIGLRDHLVQCYKVKIDSYQAKTKERFLSVRSIACCIFRPSFGCGHFSVFCAKNLTKQEICSKFQQKTVFFSLHQNAGRLFYSQKISFFLIIRKTKRFYIQKPKNYPNSRDSQLFRGKTMFLEKKSHFFWE